MTRKRYLWCDNPNCPHEKQKAMSDWVRENLPDSSTGFLVSDLDFILENWKTKNIIYEAINAENRDRPK